MPLGHQILVPGPELLRVRGTRGRAFAPQGRIADTENGIAHLRNRRSQMLFRDITPPNVLQVGVAVLASPTAHALEARVGAQPCPASSLPINSRATARPSGRSLPAVEHRQSRYLNNRCENSHRPTRQREYRMQGFRSAGHAQRFLSAYGPIAQHFRPSTASVVGVRVPRRDAEPLRELGRNHGYGAGCLESK